MAEAAPFDAIEEALGFRFGDRPLLVEALTHSSFSAENAGESSYERLEFLGDAVLELATTEMIFAAMEGEPEGPMTKVRASMVDEATLADVARSWKLPEAIRLGIGEDRSGGRDRPSILSDVVEAVIAAVHLDGGPVSASDLVRRTWEPIVRDRLEAAHVSDSRSMLQESLAKIGRTVRFEFRRSGPDHAVEFEAIAIVDDEVLGAGTGGSKKAAAIAAAGEALLRIDRGQPGGGSPADGG